MRHPIPRSLGMLALAGLICLAASAGAEKIPPDPVDEFARALAREKRGSDEARKEGKDNKARDYALEFRRRELQRAAANLTTLSEIVRALLLIWPTDQSDLFEERIRDIDNEIRDIDNEVRDKLLQRLVRGARQALRSGIPVRQAAAAMLIGEAAVASSRDTELALVVKLEERRRLDEKIRRTRRNLVTALDRLAPDVAALTSSPDPSVRGAAAHALGQMPRRPYTAARGLDRILATDNGVVNRRTAAAGLGNLVQASTGTDLLKASEPGVIQREARGKQLETLKERIAVLAAVIPVAARGLGDPDAGVRRESASALEQATGALAHEISVAAGGSVLEDRGGVEMLTVPRDIKSYPPRGRKQLSKDEREAILFGLKSIQKFEDEIKPAIAALTVSRVNSCSIADMLVNAAGDPDVGVRLGVRRAFEEIARSRRFLLDLRDLLPRLDEENNDEEKLPLPKNKKKDGENNEGAKEEEADLTRDDIDAPVWPTSGRPAARDDEMANNFPPPPEKKGRPEDEDDAEKLNKPDNKNKNKPDNKNKNNEKEPEDKGLEDPFAKCKVERDALTRMLTQMAREVIRRGTTDTNAAGRRASLEGIEAMGEIGAEFIPQLVAALRDPDRFVRWIAARTLGKLAPASARDVVPGLAALLGEIDLDVRIAGIDALGQYNSSSAGAVPLLAAHLNKGDMESRSAILRALEKIGSPAVQALPAVRPLLSVVDPRLRAEAARLIGLLGRLGHCGQEYLPDLRHMLRDPDSGVRAAASAAILRLTDR